MRARLAAIALVIPLGLAACATGVAELPADARAVDLQGRAAVVGRVVFLHNGVAKTPYSAWVSKPKPKLLRIETDETMGASDVAADGTFRWLLPPGTYLVRSIRYDQVFFPQVVFQVPPGAAAVYVGTLRMDATGTQVLARFFPRKVGVSVVDESDAAKGELARRQPALAAALVTRLMAYDPAIPHDPAEADRNAWLQILNAIGFGLLVVR